MARYAASADGAALLEYADVLVVPIVSTHTNKLPFGESSDGLF